MPNTIQLRPNTARSWFDENTRLHRSHDGCVQAALVFECLMKYRRRPRFLRHHRMHGSAVRFVQQTLHPGSLWSLNGCPG
jgi:hypothetical protein